MEYMIYRVDNGREVRGPDGLPKIVYMAWSTLMTLRWDLRKIAYHKAVPPFTREEMNILDQQLKGQASDLKQRYELQSRKKKAVIFGKNDCKTVIAELLNHPDSWEIAVQSVLPGLLPHRLS